MKFSDEQIHDILKLKDHITDKIEKHKEEIDMLEKNLNILNSVLKESSFTKASALSSNKTKTSSATSIPITNGSGGEVIQKYKIIKLELIVEFLTIVGELNLSNSNKWD